MTIALGILTPDAVVIAADTQEGAGVPGAVKTSGYKILSRVVRGEDRAISATGAGWAGYLDSLNQSLVDAFVSERAPMRAEAKMRLAMQRFYSDHILPLEALPDDSRPSAHIIVGMTWKNQLPVLLANQLSSMRRIYDQQFVAVGSGREHAEIVLSRILPRGAVTTKLAALMAAYTVFHVKEYVEGCGKDTHVTILQNGEAFHLSEAQVGLLERQFDRHRRFDAMLVNYILGRPVGDEKEAKNLLIGMMQDMRKEVMLPLKFQSKSWGPDPGWVEDTKPLDSRALQPIRAYVDPPTPSSPPNRKKKAGQ